MNNYTYANMYIVKKTTSGRFILCRDSTSLFKAKWEKSPRLIVKIENNINDDLPDFYVARLSINRRPYRWGLAASTRFLMSGFKSTGFKKRRRLQNMSNST